MHCIVFNDSSCGRVLTPTPQPTFRNSCGSATTRLQVYTFINYVA